MPEYVPYLSSNLLSITVPMFLPRGFSANLVLLLWYFLGGVCLWACQGNILALMFKKVYEEPVDTVQDVTDRGLIPIVKPGARFYVDLLTRSEDRLYRDLAKITVVAENYSQLYSILEHNVQGAATHVFLNSGLRDFAWCDEDRCYPNMEDLGKYHLSQDVLSGHNPYVGYIVNKYFHLKEELAKHILIFQQVCEIFCMNISTALFQAGLVGGFVLSEPAPPPTPSKQAIEGKHLLLPFLMLGLGFGIAVLVFMAGSVRALCK